MSAERLSEERLDLMKNAAEELSLSGYHSRRITEELAEDVLALLAEREAQQAEIDRLRADDKRRREECAEVCADNIRLRMQVAVLREALTTADTRFLAVLRVVYANREKWEQDDWALAAVLENARGEGYTDPWSPPSGMWEVLADTEAIAREHEIGQ